MARLQKWTNALISVGAGMLLGLCLAEFIPHSFSSYSPWTPLLFLVGVFAVIFSEKYLAPLLIKEHIEMCGHSHSHAHSHGHGYGHGHSHSSISPHVACSSIGCVLICAFFDGSAILAGFEVGDQTGYLVTAGMFLHALPEGVLVASLGLAGGLSKKTVKWNVFAVSAAILLGGLMGALSIELLSFELIVLPLATGVLLYLSLGHLMPMALQEKGGLVGLLLGAIVAVGFSFGHAHASDHHHDDDHGHSHSHGAHVHGDAKLQMALEGQRLDVIFEVPQQDVLGFEAETLTEAQKKTQAKATKKLEKFESVFVPSMGAKCDLTSKPDVDWKKGSHGDLRLTYSLECKNPNELKAIDLSVFKTFPSIQKVKIEALIGDKSRAVELNPKNSNFNLD